MRCHNLVCLARAGDDEEGNVCEVIDAVYCLMLAAASRGTQEEEEESPDVFRGVEEAGVINPDCAEDSFKDILWHVLKLAGHGDRPHAAVVVAIC